MDPVKAEEHNAKGNELFAAKNWAAAKAEFDEAIKRNPKDPRLYSNRAAAHTKLQNYSEVLKDLGECLKLDPTATKPYSRKDVAHSLMEELDAQGPARP